jgi:hypothetical protein
LDSGVKSGVLSSPAASRLFAEVKEATTVGNVAVVNKSLAQTYFACYKAVPQSENRDESFAAPRKTASTLQGFVPLVLNVN